MINNVAFSGSILMNSLLPGAMKKALFPEIPNDDSIDCTTSTKFTSEGPLQPFFFPYNTFLSLQVLSCLVYLFVSTHFFDLLCVYISTVMTSGFNVFLSLQAWPFVLSACLVLNPSLIVSGLFDWFKLHKSPWQSGKNMQKMLSLPRSLSYGFYWKVQKKDSKQIENRSHMNSLFSYVFLSFSLWGLRAGTIYQNNAREPA